MAPGGSAGALAGAVFGSDSDETDDDEAGDEDTGDEDAGDQDAGDEDAGESEADIEASDDAEPTAADEFDHAAEAPKETATAAPAEAEPEPAEDADPGPTGQVVDSGGVEWGARWHESAQGWVEDSSGQATWRPIVTTASTLSEWEVDTYLGIVVGDTPVSAAAPMDTAMALSRQQAIRLMVEEALARGAHAVIGVALSVNDLGSVPLATASGTAVTLKPGDA